MEYDPAPGTEPCALCSALLTDSYFVAGGRKLCPPCADRIRQTQSGLARAPFVRGMLFGVAGATGGLVIYAVVTFVARGWTIGYLALAVGWVVAKSILYGSRGVGGRRYQIAAALLTYAAISLSSVPVLLYEASVRPELFPDRSILIRELIVYGIASPFLRFGSGAFGGLLGLVILSVGIRIAWQLTRGVTLDLSGPYPVGNLPQV